MTFQRWRQKPVVVEAVQWDGTPEGATPIINWILENDGTANYYGPGKWDNGEPRASYIKVQTLEGRMLVSKSDWVIRGIKGAFYPCKPDIFERIYEPEAMCDNDNERAPGNKTSGSTKAQGILSALKAKGLF